jgi:hypothetical protein
MYRDRGITFRFVADLSTREAAVESGEIQAAMAIEATDFARFLMAPAQPRFPTQPCW